MIELVGIIAVVGVVLNAKRMTSCFYVWMVSNSISLGLHVYAAMTVGADTWALAGRDVMFLVLAFYGLKSWRKDPKISTASEADRYLAACRRKKPKTATKQRLLFKD